MLVKVYVPFNLPERIKKQDEIHRNLLEEGIKEVVPDVCETLLTPEHAMIFFMKHEKSEARKVQAYLEGMNFQTYGVEIKAFF